MSVNTTPGRETSETATAKEYMTEHRGKIMVLQRAEGMVPQSTDFFTVESVGTHPSGLIITAVFEHNRRQRLRPAEVREATESEIAAQKVGSAH
jgi:hypothetical protein